MARLYSDLADGSGRRYYFSLASAPGGVQPSTATLTIGGFEPTVFQQSTVFRAPAPALLTFNALLQSPAVPLIPAAAGLTLVGQISGEYRSTVITNSVTPIYTDLPEAPPTVLFINTVTPAPALLTFNAPPINVTQGGNIAFISVGVGSLLIQGRAPTVIFLEVGVGSLSIQGLAPTLSTTLTIEPAVGIVSINGLEVSLQTPFQWIDVDPPPTVSWTTTTGVAA